MKLKFIPVLLALSTLVACGSQAITPATNAPTTAPAAQAVVPTMAATAAPATATTPPAATAAPAASATIAMTATPVATDTPAVTETSAATETPAVTDTPIPSPTPQLQQISIGNLTTYTHPNGLFSIKIPADWTKQDSSTPDEVLMSWTDPTKNGVFVVDVFERPQQSKDQLTTLLKDFLTESYKDKPNFTMENPVPQSDGSILLIYNYTATAANGVTYKLLGNSFIDQKGNKVNVETFTVPDVQYREASGTIDTILNSLKVNPSAPLT